MPDASLGKRKERNQGSEPDVTPGSTLFISNLPYTATSTELQTLFFDYAPVRSAFVVTQHGTGVSKGVGYVSFAIREDAQSAYIKIASEGGALDGRNLRVQWAKKKGQARAWYGSTGDGRIRAHHEARQRAIGARAETRIGTARDLHGGAFRFTPIYRPGDALEEGAQRRRRGEHAVASQA